MTRRERTSIVEKGGHASAKPTATIRVPDLPDGPALPAELDREPGLVLTPEQAEALRKVEPCRHCLGRHTRACPRVKRLVFHPNGALAEVEFWRAGQWDESSVIWAEDLEE